LSQHRLAGQLWWSHFESNRPPESFGQHVSELTADWGVGLRERALVHEVAGLVSMQKSICGPRVVGLANHQDADLQVLALDKLVRFEPNAGSACPMTGG
jgi:hypothetical protein